MSNSIIPKDCQQVGTNVFVEVKDNVACIFVDLSKDFGVSKSGKSSKIGTTGGAMACPTRDDIKLNINVYKPQQG